MGRNFARRTGAPKRLTDWSASSPVTGPDVVAATTKALLEVFTPIVAGETVVRTRGFFGYESDQVAATEFFAGAFGIGVVTKVAAGIGITAIPGPATDAGWDGWLYHRYFANRFEFISGVGVEANPIINIEIDSKAMRKVTEDDRLVVVAENSASAGMQIMHAIRILTKPF